MVSIPHYADGTSATVGDIVRGKGYNQRDDNGDLAEIVAVVTGVTPGSESCNVTLLIPNGALGHFTTSRANGSQGDAVTGHVLTGIFEYGQADHFRKVS